jgi:tetratricopeptide (TPR) repeat protein
MRMNQDPHALPRLKTNESLWILGPWRDLFFFVLTPCLIIPPLLFLQHRVDLMTLAVLVLGIGGFGHHLPGFLRAYSDPALFQRHKLRFVVVPLLLAVLCGVFAFYNLNALTFAVATWGTWHGAMQVNGFLRIYDSKVRSFAARTARLDWLMCVAWFGAGIWHSPVKEFSLFSHFYQSGGPLIPPGAFATARLSWDVGTAAITLLFIVNAIQQWRIGTPPSPIKLLSMVTSFGFWWYCMAGLNNLILGVVMWEIFHDVQYNALVWIFQHKRVIGNQSVSKVEQFLFRPGYGRLAFYLALIAAYGYLGVVSSYVDIHLPEKMAEGDGSARWLLRVLAVSALLHFYYDGFIWRVREKSIRAGLGFKEAASGNLTPDSQEAPKIRKLGPVGIRHGFMWLLLFVIPIAWMGYSQYRGKIPDIRTQFANLAEAIPDSWTAHFMNGTFYKVNGDYARAAEQYAQAVQNNPDFDIAHMLLADMLFKTGDTAHAVLEYAEAVRLNPGNLEALQNLAYLRLQRGQYAASLNSYEAAIALAPRDPALHFGAAVSLMRLSRLADAESQLQETIRLDPRHARALHYLGMLHTVNGRNAQAIEYYERALALDPQNAEVQENLNAARAQAQ